MTEETADLNAFVALLDELGPVLMSADDGAALTAVCRVASLTTHAAAASVAVLDVAAEELRYVAAAGAADDLIVGTRLPLGRGIAGFVVSSGQSVAVSDVRADPRFAADVAGSVGYMPTALTAVPIRYGEDTIGVLSLLDAEEADLSVAAGFASLAAIHLHGAMSAATLGRVVAQALAAQAHSVDLADALRTAADGSTGASADLAELAALYAELGRVGEDARATAIRIVAQFTAHAAGSQPRLPVRRPRR